MRPPPCALTALKIAIAGRGTALARFEPVEFDPAMVDRVEATAQRLGHSTLRMPSGAGHDAQEVAHIAPMGMIFVPSVGGISHSPKEFSRADDIANGANVLMNAVVAADRVME